MERLSFDYCTIATGKSVISSFRAAKRTILKRGLKGTVDLYRVIIAPNREIPCWVCKYEERVIYMMPVFRNEPPLPNGEKYAIQKMTGNELFCYKDAFFRTYLNSSGEIGIRAVMIFPDEALVRAACQVKGYNVVSVTPVRVLDDKTQKYLAAAWFVRCMDCDTDFAITFMDLREGLVLEGFDLLNNACYQNLNPGEDFLAYNTYYQAMNDGGEWYLKKSPMQVCSGSKQ